LRIAVAARAIREGQSVTEAAYSVGFNSVSFFSRSFRKHFGMSPRHYREQRTSAVSPRS
jgi:AraC-like DNA-binding protein